MELRNLKMDLSIFHKLGFKRCPVGVKFLYSKPEGFNRLDAKLHFCAMIGETQRRMQQFYVDKENDDCYGKKVLGMEPFAPFAEAGEIGPELGIFQEPMANARIYFYAPFLKQNTVNYVIFSPLDELNFEPDLLIITTDNVGQAELILRAMSYSTGKPWVSKHSFVLGCAWIFVYPYISGEINYLISGMTLGSKVLKEPPEGSIVISIPHDWLPTITRNLQEMPWTLPSDEKVRMRIRDKFGEI